MAKRSVNVRHSEWIDEPKETTLQIDDGIISSSAEIELESKIETEPIVEETSETIKLVLLKGVNLTYWGKVSGKLYVFNGSGSTQDVDKRDVDIMLTKWSGGVCCPGSPGFQPYFDIVR
jgi:hypothetical protein